MSCLTAYSAVAKPFMWDARILIIKDANCPIRSQPRVACSKLISSSHHLELLVHNFVMSHVACSQSHHISYCLFTISFCLTLLAYNLVLLLTILPRLVLSHITWECLAHKSLLENSIFSFSFHQTTMTTILKRCFVKNIMQISFKKFCKDYISQHEDFGDLKNVPHACFSLLMLQLHPNMSGKFYCSNVQQGTTISTPL